MAGKTTISHGTGSPRRLLVAVTAAVALLAPPFAAAAETADPPPVTHVVHAGALVPEDKPYIYQDYYPRHLQVHQGDLVRWEFPAEHLDTAFHTVTFAESSDEAPWFRDEEAPGTLAWGEKTFFTTGCGRSGQDPCDLTHPDEFVSSGTPIEHFQDTDSGVEIEPFEAVINLPVGTYEYFCTIHDPVMRGTIEVVPDDVELVNSKPEDFADEIAELKTDADELFTRLSENPRVTKVAGQRVWTVSAGARTPGQGGVGIISFLPSSLSVSPGDAVRWVPGDEAHGVTFPDHESPAAWYFSFGCEFDAPDAGAPGVPLAGFAGFFGLPSCPDSELEMLLTPQGANPVRAPRDAVLSSATVHNSGVLVPRSAAGRAAEKGESGRRFPSEFRATFPLDDLVLPYRCQIHGALMGGSIEVASDSTEPLVR